MRFCRVMLNVLIMLIALLISAICGIALGKAIIETEEDGYWK